MVGATRINSQKDFENELPVFSTLINGKGYEAGNPIKLKVWSGNNIVSADFTMEAIYDSYVSDTYPSEDGRYSIVNVTKGAEFANEKILVFPNPATEHITIVSTSEIRKISIFNCFGQLIYENNIKDINTQINTSVFKKGVYVIKVETTIGLESHKIIIK